MTNKTFDSGAIREDIVIPRYSLIPPSCIRRLALIYNEGATRYGDYNWTKGLPYTNTLDHALEHLTKYLTGDRSEDHLAKVVWGMFVLMYQDDHHNIEPDVKWPLYLLSQIADIGIDTEPTKTDKSCFVCKKPIYYNQLYHHKEEEGIVYHWHVVCKIKRCKECNEAIVFKSSRYVDFSDGTSMCSKCSDELELNALMRSAQ